MKKILALLACIGLFFGGCSKVEKSQPMEETVTQVMQRACASQEVLERQ